MTTTSSTTRVDQVDDTRDRRIYQAITGVAGIVILLQAVWAGLFIREGQDYTASWVEIHARGADLAIGLAAIATVFALVKLRSRRDLWVGAGLVVLLLVGEAYVGGEVGAHPNMTILHFPLGMALMGLAVWLPLRAGRAR